MKNLMLHRIASKVLYTLGILMLLTIANNTMYPGLSSIIHGVSNIDKNVLDVYAITSQGIRPNVFAGIIINLITSISQYFNNIQRKAETKAIYEKIYIALIVIISITYSLIQYAALIPFIKPDLKPYFFTIYSLINIAMALFYTWLNRRLLINGIGNGITVILTIQILNKFINASNITSVLSLFKVFYHNWAYIVLMLAICSIFEEIYLSLSVVALNPKSQYIIDSAKEGAIKYKPTQANVTAHVLTAQVKNISLLIKHFIYNSNNIYVYNSFMRHLYSVVMYFSNINYVISQMFYFLALFLFNYIYNTVYYHRLDRILENIKNNICYINEVRINDIAKYMSIAAAKAATIAVAMTVTLILMPKLINKFFVTSIKLNPIDLLIMSSAFMHFKQFFARVFIYYEFRITSSSLVRKRSE